MGVVPLLKIDFLGVAVFCRWFYTLRCSMARPPGTRRLDADADADCRQAAAHGAWTRACKNSAWLLGRGSARDAQRNAHRLGASPLDADWPVGLNTVRWLARELKASGVRRSQPDAGTGDTTWTLPTPRKR